jgi:hypothetical protein
MTFILRDIVAGACLIIFSFCGAVVLERSAFISEKNME